MYFIFRLFYLILHTYFTGNPSSIPTSDGDGEKIDEVRSHDEENLWQKWPRHAKEQPKMECFDQNEGYVDKIRTKDAKSDKGMICSIEIRHWPAKQYLFIQL